MKHFKHLLFLSILCSLVLFSSCDWGLAFWDATKDTRGGSDDFQEKCSCGYVRDVGYISEIEAAGDSVSCYRMIDYWNADVYITLENDCSRNIKTFCGSGIDTVSIDYLTSLAYGGTDPKNIPLDQFKCVIELDGW